MWDPYSRPMMAETCVRLIFDFLMMGELFQNNHHKLPNSMNFGAKWYEIDPTYPVIKVLTWLRIIRPNVKPADAQF